MAKFQQWYATGRRKEAAARVFLRPGTGKVKINGREVEEYFRRATLKMVMEQPLHITESMGTFDMHITVAGGGLAGQASAVRMGISRALCTYNSDHRPALKRAGFLERDARAVERKKYGRAGARKRFQFSKR